MGPQEGQASPESTAAGEPAEGEESTATQTDSGDRADGDSQGAADEQPDSVEADPSAEPGSCAVKQGSSQIPAQTPSVDEWTMVQGTAVPVSTTAGPYVQQGDLWTCYEHSAEGALFAITYAFAASGNVEGFLGEWIAEPDLRELAGDDANIDGEAEDMEGTVTILGYRYQAYSEELAIIDVAAEYVLPEGAGIVSMRMALRWEDDRWVMDFENFGADANVIESLDGYSLWR